MDTNVVQRVATSWCRHFFSICPKWPSRYGEAELDKYDDDGEGKESTKDPQDKGQAYTLGVQEDNGCRGEDSRSYSKDACQKTYLKTCRELLDLPIIRLEIKQRVE